MRLNATLTLLVIIAMTIIFGTILSRSYVFANDVVDEINIAVPVSCSMSGTGMTSHNANISNGTYQANIGTTTLHAFCNDSEGFAIYAAGYTGDEIGATNSNKLVGVSTSATIETGLATSAGNPDVSNWAMKLAITQDSGDTTGANAYTIDSAPNTSGGADASFSQYHVVPNEYTKVAHKNSATDMTVNTGGVKLTTTYAAYISKTQPADTYAGQVIYTLVHPSNADMPVHPNQVGVIYHGNGQTFAGGASENKVVYGPSSCTPMYAATTPVVAETSNFNNGVQSGGYTDNEYVLLSRTFTGASKVRVVVNYGFTGDTAEFIAIDDTWDGDWENWNSEWDDNWIYSDHNISGTKTYIFDSDTVTIFGDSWDSPESGHDYGFYVRVYPIYTTEQSGSEKTWAICSLTNVVGNYVTPTNWYGYWKIELNDEIVYFSSEDEVKNFLKDNDLNGATIDLYSDDKIIQGMLANRCAQMNIGDTIEMIDIRDKEEYLVGKLADGNCWMLDNLRLNPTDDNVKKKMNENNTNAPNEAIEDYYPTSWLSSFTAPAINVANKNTVTTSYGLGSGKIGVFYNYCAATMGTYCYGYSDGVDIPGTSIDAPYDICPANWRLPNIYEYETLRQAYSTTTMATDLLSPQYNASSVLSGFIMNSTIDNIGSWGDWWTSTYYGIYSMQMYEASSTSFAWGSASRHSGASIRCLVSEPE